MECGRKLLGNEADFIGSRFEKHDRHLRFYLKNGRWKTKQLKRAEKLRCAQNRLSIPVN